MAYLKMMGEVYDIFGLDYKMALSTRPEGYLGELEVWNQAEKALEEALNETGREWEVSGHGRIGSGSSVVFVLLVVLLRPGGGDMQQCVALPMQRLPPHGLLRCR